MKRLTLLVSFLFSAASCISQPQNTSIYSKGFCKCLDSLGTTTDVERNFPICFQMALARNSAAFMNELIKTYGDSTEEKVNKLTDELSIRMSIDLIASCASYYKFIESSLQQQSKNLNRDSLRRVLNQLDTFNIARRDKQYYQYAGTLYFQLGDYDNALKNIENVLSQDPTNATGIFIKASISEKKGNYSEAEVLYEKIAKLTKKNVFLLYSAVARRKKNGL